MHPENLELFKIQNDRLYIGHYLLYCARYLANRARWLDQCHKPKCEVAIISSHFSLKNHPTAKWACVGRSSVGKHTKVSMQ